MFFVVVFSHFAPRFFFPPSFFLFFHIPRKISPSPPKQIFLGGFQALHLEEKDAERAGEPRLKNWIPGETVE